MPKGTFRAEATLNSVKIKPVALAVIELHLSEGINQSVTYSVSRKFRQIKILKIPYQLVESVSGRSESLSGLSFTSPILPHRHKGKLRLVFLVILFCGPRLLLCGPY